MAQGFSNKLSFQFHLDLEISLTLGNVKLTVRYNGFKNIFALKETFMFQNMEKAHFYEKNTTILVLLIIKNS